MERRKKELRATFHKLKEESTGIVQHLNTILDKHQENIARIESLSDKQILANSQYFIAASQSQFNSMMKLIAISMDLESFACDVLEPEVDNASLNGSLNNNSLSQQSEPETAEITSCSLNNLSRQTNDSVRISPAITPAASNDTLSPAVTDNTNKVTDDDEINANKTESDPDVIIESIKTDSSSSSSDFTKKKSTRETEPTSTQRNHKSDENYDSLIKSSLLVNEIKTEESRGINGSESNKIEESRGVNEIKTEENRVVKSSLSEKLCQANCMSRRDRYLQSRPKPKIPDLSFKLKSSSSEYFSAGTEEPKTKKLKKNPEQKKICSPRKCPGEILEEIKCTYVISERADPEVNESCVIISYVSPSEFYITCVNDDAEVLESLNLQIGEFIKSSAISSLQFTCKSAARYVLEKFCTVHCPDYNSWCRGQIIDWGKDESSDQVQVQLIDYGEYRTVPLKDLQVLPNIFCHLPKFVTKCHLAYLYPPGSTEDNVLTEWPEETLGIFEEIISDPEENLFKLVYTSKTSNSLAVDLVSNTSQNQDYTFGQMLIDQHLASEVVINEKVIVIQNSFIREQLKSAQNMAGITGSMSHKEQMEKFFENLPTDEPENLAVALTNYDAQDDTRICRFTRKDGTCFKGRNCHLEHRAKRKDGYTTDKHDAFINAQEDLEVPSAGDVIQIFITYVCNSREFYGHIWKNGRKGSALRELNETLNRGQKHRKFDVLPTFGEIVLAKNWDKKWYRAMVVEIDSHLEKDLIVQVFFVDIGEKYDVTLEDIRQIRTEMLRLPFQAVKFNISNILPTESEPKEMHFEKYYLGKVCTGKVIYSGSGFIDVLLYDDEMNDIGEEIIKSGQAVLNTNWLTPNASEGILVD